MININFRDHIREIDKAINIIISELKDKKIYKDSGYNDIEKKSGYIGFNFKDSGINYYIEKDYIEILSGSYKAKFSIESTEGVFKHSIKPKQKQFEEFYKISNIDLSYGSFKNIFDVFLNDLGIY